MNVTPRIRSKRLPNSGGDGTVPDHSELERCRRAFAAKLYDMLLDPRSLRALRELLTHRDLAIRAKAWHVVLPHVTGNGAAVNGGTAAEIVIVNHMPRRGQAPD
jgi:site-specific recombinase XerC